MYQMYNARSILGILIGVAEADTSSGSEHEAVLRTLRAIAQIVGILPAEFPPQLRAGRGSR